MFQDETVKSRVKALEQVIANLNQAKQEGNTDDYEGLLMDLRDSTTAALRSVQWWKEVNE